MGTYRKKIIIEEVNRKLERRYLLEQETIEPVSIGKQYLLKRDSGEEGKGTKMGYVTIKNIDESQIGNGVVLLTVEPAQGFDLGVFGQLIAGQNIGKYAVNKVMGKDTLDQKAQSFVLKFSCAKQSGTHLRIQLKLPQPVFCNEISKYYYGRICESSGNKNVVRSGAVQSAYADAEYSVIDRGVQNDKVKKSEIENMIKAGTLNRDTNIWRPGMENWVKLGTLPEFKNIFMQQPPPPPPSR